MRRSGKSSAASNVVPGNPDCQWCHGRGCLACKPVAKTADTKPSDRLVPVKSGCNCSRCGRGCRVAGPWKENAELFRRGKVPSGVCADCVVTQFLYNTYPINMQIDEGGPELLLKPGIREAFLSCGILERADLTIDEISWERIVANWALPVLVRKNDPRNPYRMGDAERARQARREAGLLEERSPRDWFRGANQPPQSLPPGCFMRDGTIFVDAAGFRSGGGDESTGFGSAIAAFLRDVDTNGRPS